MTADENTVELSPRMAHVGATRIDGDCLHERSAISDSAFHGAGYSTRSSRRIFCDVCRLQRWLDIEAALALSQAELGLIPAKAAHLIAASARVERIDLNAVREGVAVTGHSLVPLLRELERVVGGYPSQFIHHGATTQDIQDTGQALEMRDVLDLVERDLIRLLDRLDDTAVAHRDQLIVGRTHAQPALPTTFGLKVAGWIDELTRHVVRIRQARPRLLVAQLFGGVGTMASFRDRGPALLAAFAGRLGLAVPDVCWHVVRDRVAEFVFLMASVTAVAARIADEVRTLGRPELGELDAAWGAGKLGSSTMPHKRNPEDAEQVVVLARLARAQVALGLECMIVEHERDYRGTRLEWPALAGVSHAVLAALDLLDRVVADMRVRSDVMERTARRLADVECSEALVFALAKQIGKARAFEYVHRMCQQALDENESIKACALRSPELGALLEREELELIFEPNAYLGSSQALIAQVLATRRAVCGARRELP